MIKVFFALLFLSHMSSARMFNMKDSRFGGYLNLTYGASEEKKDYFEGESSATDFSKGFSNHTGGEFGFLYKAGYVSFLFGLELINTGKVKGTSSDYSYSADLSTVIPKLGAEIVFYETPGFRFLTGISMGSASVVTKNSYSSVNISPNADFEIEGKGTASLINYGVAAEWHLNDNTTFLLGAHRRELAFNKIKYVKDVSSSFTGSHTKGEQIKKSDGSDLSYDFGGYYFSFGLRFWLF